MGHCRTPQPVIPQPGVSPGSGITQPEHAAHHDGAVSDEAPERHRVPGVARSGRPVELATGHRGGRRLCRRVRAQLPQPRAGPRHHRAVRGRDARTAPSPAGRVGAASRGWRARWRSSSALLFIVSFLGLAIGQVVSNFDDLSNQASNGVTKVSDWLESGPLHIKSRRAREQASRKGVDRFKNDPTKALSGTVTVLSTTGGLLAGSSPRPGRHAVPGARPGTDLERHGVARARGAKTERRPLRAAPPGSCSSATCE